MKQAADERARVFRRLHGPGELLVLPNAWDAASARLIESCGATAIATTSAGVAWAHGYPDGDALPPTVLTTAAAEIVRVVSVPLSVDVEGGYSDDPRAAAGTVAAVVAAGAVGINLEDGAASPELLCAKVAAVRAAAGAGLFINVRTDVYLRGLVPPERAVHETIERGRRYQAAGCDGLFVPGLSDAGAIREIVQALDLPLNVMIVPGLPSVSELRALGVRRLSAGSGIAQGAYGFTRAAATGLLRDGLYDAVPGPAVGYGELNVLLRGDAG
jgi:2-methylisocitrate lyase-like PEP mutase family enzyme